MCKGLVSPGSYLVEVFSVVRSFLGTSLLFFCSKFFLIFGASHAAGFLNEDALQHSLKDSKMVNKNEACAVFEIVSRERVSVVISVGIVCRWYLAALSVGGNSRWC